MAKKLLTLDDLVQFCSTNNLTHFSAQEFGHQIGVQIPASFEKVAEDSSTLYIKVKAFHTGLNRNHSNVTEEAAEKCMIGMKYKPILANFCEYEDEDGNILKDFTSHDMKINDDGTVEYLERQVGCFTADEPWMEDESDGRKFVYAYAAIPREYTPAAEIIERKDGSKTSVELSINTMSYDAQKKELVLEDIEVMGCTLLGKNPDSLEDVQEGMLGARVDIADFSIDKPKFDIDTKLIEVIEKLDTVLSHFDIDNSTRKEDITLQENFEDEIKKIPGDDDTAPIVEEETSDDEPEVVSEDEPSVVSEEEAPDEEPETTAEEPETDGESESFAVKFSVEMGEIKKEFGLSLSDKQNAVYQLVNETYGEQDNEWYDVEFYDEDNYVVMHGFFNGKHFRQGCKKKKCSYALVGDRTEVFAQFLTEDEIAQLESLKASYAETSEKLEKYESEPEKVKILESKDYGYVSETEEFAELKKQENHFDLTVEEVKAKADSILLDYAKKGSFSSIDKEEKAEIGKKTLPVMPKAPAKKSRYGGMFPHED